MTSSQVSAGLILAKPSMEIGYTEEYSICCSLGSKRDGTVATFWEQRKSERAGEYGRRHLSNRELNEQQEFRVVHNRQSPGILCKTS